ncbi:MAG: dihydrofolate reductase family protein [Rhizobiaceae bacterium]|jgi:dihydrofolate reductase|nr:dihydrofolate reductase family protein [Rhizobiaceae bacterium]
MRIFIAQTLDGFIAGPNDSLDHLGPFHGVETGYDAMLAQAGAVVLGRRTFDRIFPTYGWTYPDTLQGCVLTRRELPVTTPAHVAAMQDVKAIARRYPHAFIDGGAETIAQFMRIGAIDTADIFTLPVRLGGGVRLFADQGTLTETWTLVDVRALDQGMVHARYRIGPRR